MSGEAPSRALLQRVAKSRQSNLAAGLRQSDAEELAHAGSLRGRIAGRANSEIAASIEASRRSRQLEQCSTNLYLASESARECDSDSRGSKARAICAGQCELTGTGVRGGRAPGCQTVAPSRPPPRSKLGCRASPESSAESRDSTPANSTPTRLR